MKQPIYEVKQVRARLEGNEVVTEAEGTTRTNGWTDPELKERQTTGDTLEYEFIATPPPGSSNPVITPISANTRTGPLLPPFPTYVLVAAETNEMRVPIESGVYAPPPSEGGARPTA